jgi:Tfp pilus assembly protein PilX
MNTVRIRAFAAWHDTRGIILPLTLFIVVLLAGLVVALLSVGGMESQISANLLRGTQAFDLADAGAERAIAQFVVTPALVGNATCSPTCGAPTTLFSAQALASLGTYTVTYQPVGPNTVLVQSTGQSAIGGVTQKIQVVVTVPFQNAFAVEGDDLELTGSNVKINGTAGSIYGLSKVNITGSGDFVQRTATSSGSTSASCYNCKSTSYVGNVTGSGWNAPPRVLPTDDAMTYKPMADYLLQDDGTILVQTSALAGQGVAAGTVINCGAGSSCPAGPFAGWDMVNTGLWLYRQNSNPPDGMYYASQEISIDGNGSGGPPWKATLLSGAGSNNPNNTGEWEINGSNWNIVPYYQNLFGLGGAFVISGNNVTLSGTMIATTKSRGFSQPMDNGGPVPSVQLLGNNVTINGQLLSDGQVVMSGSNFTLNYNPAGGGSLFGTPQIMSWTRLAQ